jgi:hypothetical protein
MSSSVYNNAEMDTSPPSILQKCGNSCNSPLFFFKNAEINTCPPVFSTMRKWTDLTPLILRNVEINTSPPSAFQKCGN